MKLALYLTFPYPSSEIFQRFFNAMMNERFDYLELGIPTSKPYYDGPVIRKTHKKAMESFSFSDLKETVSIAKKSGKRTFALVYYNHFSSNREEFLDQLKESGMDGAIVPDILTDYFDERVDLAKAMDERGLSLIPFFTSSTPDKVISEVIKQTHDWIYHGLQPSTGIRVPVSMDILIKRIRNLAGEREVIFGFGINSLDMIKNLRDQGADGIAIGSSLVSYMDGNDLDGFMKEVKRLGGAVYD
ncbi:tryptophan synthase subunit alpha [Cuniculiplasma sp. SKW4]|uniref:tryptophan synthase subunit alpha n=1 Tax=Cuniculiplasma sp. SKW4 TaxID=3400171 RepID=UPI003FCFCC0B